VNPANAHRVLFLGNSITLHAPAPELGWFGNWGMAASAPEQDYVHLLLRCFTEASGGRAPEAMVENLVVDFERQYDTFDVERRLQEHLAFAADVVIVALGENVVLDTAEAPARFGAALGTLLAALTRSHPTLLVRSCFWPDPVKDGLLREACAGAGGLFADIGRLSLDESNFAYSEATWENGAVGGHPGDKGMAALADALWSALTADA
jgi:lysophospholipase L1-like esterase